MPTAATARPGATFAFDAVAPVTTPLPTRRTHDAMREAVGPIESCSDYHGEVVSDHRLRGHPLLAAVHTAFADHRPLVLTPDAVWLTVAQGVAHHMAARGERLRARFVAHPGRADLTAEVDGWVAGSPENPWAEALEGWADRTRRHVGPAVHDALMCDFSTSGPVERAAGRVVMSDVFERYFRYTLCCVCGIPSVTLEGTPADWQRLADKAAALAVFDMGWWLDHLLPICGQFVRASRGDVDRDHWRSIYKRQEAYGGDIINGWVAELFPYLPAFVGGPCDRRNPIFASGEGLHSSMAPSGLSRVPFTWTDRAAGVSRPMEAVAGLVGVRQDAGTGALRPVAGWAVRPADPADVLFARVAAGHRTFPGVRVDIRAFALLPADVASFYNRTDGAELFGGAVRVRPMAEVSPLDRGRADRRPLRRFAALDDGAQVALAWPVDRYGR